MHSRPPSPTPTPTAPLPPPKTDAQRAAPLLQHRQAEVGGPGGDGQGERALRAQRALAFFEAPRSTVGQREAVFDSSHYNKSLSNK